MLSYSEFLEEGLEFEAYIDLVEEWTLDHSWDGHEHENKERVSGHKVYVRMKHDDNSHKAGHYSAEFSVNDQVSRSEVPGITKRDSRAILHHVHRKISEFVRDKKPKAIHMHASDGDDSIQNKKQKMYQSFAQHLARKHGGKAWVKTAQASVHFDHTDDNRVSESVSFKMGDYCAKCGCKAGSHKDKTFNCPMNGPGSEFDPNHKFTPKDKSDGE